MKNDYRKSASQQVHIEKLILNHTRRLQILKERKALLGNLTDASIILEIEDIEYEIQLLQKQIEKIKAPKENVTSALPSRQSRIVNLDSLFSDLSKKRTACVRYNIVVVGKAGVGKSALINYLFGQIVREVGVGKAITKEGFHEAQFEINDIPVTLFDSWGLEIGNYTTWFKQLDEELKVRAAEKPSENWFHTVFYCISASSSRVEDFEIDIINRFIEEKYKVTLVFTKADLVAEEDISVLSGIVNSSITSPVKCVPVCSEEKVLRWGTTEQFGAVDIYNSIYAGFWDSISSRLPIRCVSVLNHLVDEWHRFQQAQVYKAENYTYLQKECEILLEHLDSQMIQVILDETRRLVSMYGQFSNILDYSKVSQTDRLQLGSIDLTNYDRLKAAAEFWNSGTLNLVVGTGVGFYATTSFAASVLGIAVAVWPIALVGVPALIAIRHFSVKKENESRQQHNILSQLDLFTSKIKSGINSLEPQIKEILKNMFVESEEVSLEASSSEIQLHLIIVELFNLEELKSLCFILSIDYESLPGEGKAAKARELVAYSQRHGREGELLKEIKGQRPNFFGE